MMQVFLLDMQINSFLLRTRAKKHTKCIKKFIARRGEKLLRHVITRTFMLVTFSSFHRKLCCMSRLQFLKLFRSLRNTQRDLQIKAKESMTNLGNISSWWNLVSSHSSPSRHINKHVNVKQLSLQMFLSTFQSCISILRLQAGMSEFRFAFRMGQLRLTSVPSANRH